MCSLQGNCVVLTCEISHNQSALGTIVFLLPKMSIFCAVPNTRRTDSFKTKLSKRLFCTPLFRDKFFFFSFCLVLLYFIVIPRIKTIKASKNSTLNILFNGEIILGNDTKFNTVILLELITVKSSL